MKKATPIAISGQIFYLEDDGYDLLHEYIGSLHAHFAGQDGRVEIMADIEARIAERFAELLAGDRTESIPLSRVIEVMDSIGRPGDFDELREPEVQKQGIRKRKLFRDPKGGVIAGVCEGLASYFSTDPNLIRALFIAALFFGGTGVILYIVLWIVIPRARSSADLLGMRGTPVTADSIARLFRGKSAEGGSGDGVDKEATILGFASAVADTGRGLMSGILCFVRSAAGFLLVVGGLFLILIACFGATLLTLSFPASYFDPVVVEFMQGIPTWGLILSGAVSILIPGIFILIAGMSLVKGRNLLQPAIGFGLVAVWFIALLTTGVMGTRSALQWQLFEVNHPLYQPASLTLVPEVLNSVEAPRNFATVRLVAGPGPTVTFSGRKKEVDRLSYTLVDGALVVTELPGNRSCVLCDRELIRITVTTPSINSVRVVGWLLPR